MDTILNYLENMFVNLPKTEEVLRAKQELSSMMEDKYNELLAEGRSDNEAVGIVISEFGNLKEISAELGIEEIYEEGAVREPGRLIEDDVVNDYLDKTRRASKGIGFGAMLCVFSPILLIILGGMSETGYHISENAAGAIGVSVLLILIAIAVGFFIYHGVVIEKYSYLKNENICISTGALNYLKKRETETDAVFLRHLIIGVGMCIISVIPLLVVGTIYEDQEFLMILMVGVLLFLIGIAVYLIITGSMERDAVKSLLEEGSCTAEDKKAKKLEDTVGGIYWPIITAIYLAWSFLSAGWGYTWLIWPIAGVIYAAITAICHAVKKE